MSHICIGKLTIVGSDNGSSPGWGQAIIWTNAGLLSIRTLETYFSEILSEIHTFSFKKMHLKMLSGKYWPFCLSLNVLNLRCLLWCQHSKYSNKVQSLLHQYQFGFWGRFLHSGILQYMESIHVVHENHISPKAFLYGCFHNRPIISNYCAEHSDHTAMLRAKWLDNGNWCYGCKSFLEISGIIWIGEGFPPSQGYPRVVCPGQVGGQGVVFILGLW